MDRTDARAPTRSRLAQLQRVIVLTAAFVLAHAALWWWKGAHLKATLLVLSVLSLHAWFIALEMVLAASVNRSDPAPPASFGLWLRAWWQEARLALLVFAWRQPFRWRDWPDSDVPGKPGAAPAVLIHGFVCNRGFWWHWMERMRADGLPYVSVNLEPVFGSIESSLALVEAAVQRAERLATASPKPVLVCHSMGGLVARAWLATSPANRARIDGVITIGSPHRGTWLARLAPVANARQMAPDGPWLAALVQREHDLAGSHAYDDFVCWYSHTDHIVFPAGTATLPGADNRHVPGAAHVDLAFHPRVMAESLAMLASGGRSPCERTVS